MNDCIFCKIINKELPAKIEYEDDKCIVFHSIEPIAPVHLLIVPKLHIDSIATMRDNEQGIIGYLFKIARDVAKKKNLAGYKLLINVNKEGGQVIFHIHVHLLGGRGILDSDLSKT